MKFSYAGLSEWGSLYLLWDRLLGGEGGGLLDLERIVKMFYREGRLPCVTLRFLCGPQPGTLHLIPPWCRWVPCVNKFYKDKLDCSVSSVTPSTRGWSLWPWMEDSSTKNLLSTGQLHGAVSWDLGRSRRTHAVPCLAAWGTNFSHEGWAPVWSEASPDPSRRI